MDYKEQIEKEAKELYPSSGEDSCYVDIDLTSQDGFISGVNSKISERINVEFALKILEELKQESPFPNYVPHQYINNKITKLKKQYKWKII